MKSNKLLNRVLLQMLQRIPLLLFTSSILILFIVGTVAAAPEKKKKEKPTHLVEVIKAKAVASKLSNKWHGSLEYNELVNIYNQEKGRIDIFPFKEGDRVKKGQLLVHMDDRLLRAEKSRLLAQIAQAKTDQRRIQGLVKKQAMSIGDLDQANTQLAIYNAERKLLDIRIGYFQIKAPFSGIVTERFANKGDAVSEQQHLLTLSNYQSLVAKVQVSEAALSSLTLGIPATIIIPSSGTKYVGKLSRIYPKLHPNTRQATAEITFDVNPKNLFSGQSVLAEISGAQKNRILIPLAALKRDGDGEYVFLLKEDEKKKSKAQRQGVISSNYIAGKVEITQGIKPDDIVVTRGFLGLNDGKTIKVSSLDSKAINIEKAKTPPQQIKKPDTKKGLSLDDLIDKLWKLVLDVIKS